MRSLIVIVMMTVSGFSCAVAASEKALGLFQQAQDAFEQGDLLRSEQLARQAVAIKKADGTVAINPRHSYSIQRVGRKIERISSTTADYEQYQPNALLAQIATTKQNMLALARKKDKRLAPPKLSVTKVTLIDEDRDGTVAALENASLRLTVVNSGKSAAQAVSLKLDKNNLKLDVAPFRDPQSEIAPGDSVNYEIKFQARRDIKRADGSVLISILEQDGLGELIDHAIPIQLRSYFAPVLRFDYLPQQSDQVYPNMPATQRYRITNSGRQTAFDIDLALDFALAGRVRILSDLDIPRIRFLRRGESRIVSFTLEPSNQVKIGQALGVRIATSMRGEQQQHFDTTLNVAYPSSRSSGQSSRMLAQLQQQDLPPAATAQPLENRVLLLDLAPSSKPQQFRNISFARNLFSRSLGFSTQQIKQTELIGGATRSRIKQEVAEWVQQHNTQHLLVYINATGQYDLWQQRAVLNMPQGSLRPTISLAPLLQEIALLAARDITVLIESDFVTAGDGRLREDAGLPQLYVEQPLLPDLSNKIRVIMATAATQKATEVMLEGVGTFTYALAMGLTQLGTQQLNKPMLDAWLRQARRHTRLTSKSLHDYEQIPWLH